MIAEQSNWIIPISISYPDKLEPNENKVATNFWLRNRSASLNVESRPYLLNFEASGFYRVAYEEENWRALINSLKNKKEINRLNRAQLIDDIMNLARTNHASYELALDLLLYLRLEDDFIPWEAAFRSLSFLYYRMEDSK